MTNLCQFCRKPLIDASADCCRYCYMMLDWETGLPLTPYQVKEREDDEKRRASDAIARQEMLPIWRGGRC